MYFWKVDKLIEDFKSKNVSQKEEFKYLLTYSILITLLSDRYLSLGSNYNIYDFLSTVCIVIVTIWGTWHCYKINSSGDNSSFITRITCIGLPVFVRVVAVIFPIALLVGVMQGFFLDEAISDEQLYSEYHSDIFDVVLIGLSSLVYYFYLASKIKVVSNK